MFLIVARYRSDVDGPDKVPPAPVARSRASSDSSYLAAFSARGRWEFGGPRIETTVKRGRAEGGLNDR